jgi:hypothetical protein
MAVRIPGWVRRSAIRSRVEGERRSEERPLLWIGNYLQFDALRPGDCLTLEFPVAERTEQHTAWDRIWRMQRTFTCSFRGNTLVDISPRDERPGQYPLYLRDHLKKGGAAPLRTVQRYVAPRTVVRW